MDINVETITNLALEHGPGMLFKLIGGILIWVIGSWLINGVVMKAVSRMMAKSKLDATLQRFLLSILAVMLKIMLVLAIFSYFGVETTSFAALLAGAGLAIGTAWGGLLANFAAGVFMIILRPISVGDFVTAGGITGTVKEIGLFVTGIDTMDNVRTIVGNNKIFSEVIQNFTVNPNRRVELVAQLNHSVDHKDAIARLKSRVAAIPNVSTEMPPEINILEFNLAGPKLSVRPYTHNDNYWQVYFDTNEAIREEFGKAGYPVPQKHLHIAQN